MVPRCQVLSGSLAAIRALPSAPQCTQRGFTSSSTRYGNPLSRKRGGDLGSHLPKYVIPQDVEIPAYPYGPRKLFKQSNQGLYGLQRIQFGNNVSKRTETTTRRDWKPNVLNKALYSVALKKRIHLRITSKVLKTIDREGGLDEYLLKQNEMRIKELGPMGWALRWTLLQKPVVIRRMREEALALGISQEHVDLQWPEPVVADAATEDGTELEPEAAEAAAEQDAIERDARLAEADEVDAWDEILKTTDAGAETRLNA
jgi:large subunit ribosomal protein L28